MTTMLLPPSSAKATGPRPVRWTCAEFHRMGDRGEFEGRRAMLINGVIIEEGPMNPPHAITMELILPALQLAFGAGWRIRCQLPLVFGLDVDPQPDYAVIAGSARGSSGHPTTADLVVEVADSSLDFDTNEKRLLYAAAGIPEYWVVDIAGRQLLVFRDPVDGDYAAQLTFGPNVVVSPLAALTAEVRVADLLV